MVIELTDVLSFNCSHGLMQYLEDLDFQLKKEDCCYVCRQDKVIAHAAKGKRLTGGTFYLSYPSVGATETLMMAASLADGETVLLNAAKAMLM